MTVRELLDTQKLDYERWTEFNIYLKPKRN